MFPLRAIIRASVALGISPNTLTLIAGSSNATRHGPRVDALWRLHKICANILDFIDGKVGFSRPPVRSARYGTQRRSFSDLARLTASSGCIDTRPTD